MKKDVVIFNGVNLFLPKNYVSILEEENFNPIFEISFFKKIGLNVIEQEDGYKIYGSSTIEVYDLNKVLTEHLISLKLLCQRFHGAMKIGYLINENNFNYIDLNDMLSNCA